MAQGFIDDGIGALVAAGAWWGWQVYPQWFGQSTGDAPAVAEQTAPVGRLGEAPQDVETGNIETSLPGAEDTPPLDKAEAEQPTSIEPAMSPEEAEVARLLTAAEADLNARRLTSPAGNNAWDKYQHVLSLSPVHPEATAGMERVIESYMELFGAAVKQEDFDKADGYLAKIRELHPDSPVLEGGEQSLAAAKQARADLLAEEERQRQAEAAVRQAELERQRIKQTIQEHWAAFDAALEAEDISEAVGILDQVRELNPEEPGLATGEQRLVELEQQLAIQRLWDAFGAAMDAEEFGAAASHLAEISGLNSAEPRLAEGELRLDDARRAVETRALTGEMVSIPGGTFRMGDLNGDGYDNEKPVHSVTMPSFKLGKYEVTVGQFRRFVEATGYRTDAERGMGGNEGCRTYTDDGWDWKPGRNWRNPGYAIEDNQPVVCVSWNDAQAFIEWLTEQTGETYRLPSEAEWEYAARSGTRTKYSWGNDIGHNRANCAECGSRWDDHRAAPVGSFSANAWGLHDMHGNVWEWVQDCWNKNYMGAPSDGSAWESGDCNLRVHRGGSWFNTPGRLRSANRNGFTQSRRAYDRGFRLAQDQ